MFVEELDEEELKYNANKINLNFLKKMPRMKYDLKKVADEVVLASHFAHMGTLNKNCKYTLLVWLIRSDGENSQSTEEIPSESKGLGTQENKASKVPGSFKGMQ